MRLPALALILTIFTILGSVLPVNADPRPRHVQLLRAANSNTTSSTATSSTATSSSSSTTTTTSSTSPTSSTQSTTTSTTSSIFSSSDSSSSSFSPSSSPSSTSTQASSSSQGTPSSSQSTQIIPSFTSSFVTSDTTSTSFSSQTQTRTTFTSTASNGTLFTVTAVVSSPSGGSGSSIASTEKQGFFANTGAVAGTFLVVGLVGTGILICVSLWVLRRYRRRKRYMAYFDDEDKEFNQPRERGGTPEATLPDITRESPSHTPVSSSPTPNMIERLHGNAAGVPNVSYDPSLYQAQPGEFDPYQNYGGAYAYSDDQVVYGQYPGSSQASNIAYPYQPGTEFNNNTGQQAVVEPSHAPQGAVDSNHYVANTH